MKRTVAALASLALVVGAQQVRSAIDDHDQRPINFGEPGWDCRAEDEVQLAHECIHIDELENDR